MLRLEQEGSAELTLAHYRQTAWSLFEFLGRDPPIGELDRETAARWLDWLRTTFVYRRARGAYPNGSRRPVSRPSLPGCRQNGRKRNSVAPGPSPSTAPRAAKSFVGLGCPSKSSAASAKIPPPAADRAQDRRHRRPLASHAPRPGRYTRTPPPGRVDAGPDSALGRQTQGRAYRFP